MVIEEILNGLGCEECHRSLSNANIDIYVYPDFGGWTRVYCQHHMGFSNGKPNYGAKKLRDIIAEQLKK